MMVECGACRHQWLADLQLPAPLIETAKRMHRLRCPMCEAPSDRIFIAVARPEADERPGPARPSPDVAREPGRVEA